MLAFVEVCKVVGASFLVVLAADTVLRYAPGFNAASTRYNLLHALLNTYVVVSVVPDCYFVLANPLEAMSAPYSDVPLATTIGLHLFHCVSQYKSLTTVDWAHHLVSNMLVSFLCFPYDYGPLMQWGLLFICGLPGGIDYYLLTLVKLGTIAPSTEKRINRLLNTWIRAPGIVSWAPLMLCCRAAGKSRVPDSILAMQVALNMFNAMYFQDRVVPHGRGLAPFCPSPVEVSVFIHLGPRRRQLRGRGLVRRTSN